MRSRHHSARRYAFGLPHTLHNRVSVTSHLLIANEHPLHRMRTNMVAAVITALESELKATHPRHMSVALRASRNQACANSSAFLFFMEASRYSASYQRTSTQTARAARLSLSPLAEFRNTTKAPIDQRDGNEHGFGVLQSVGNDSY